MTLEDFFDFKHIRNQIPNMGKTVDRNSVKFMSGLMYTVRKGDPLVTIHYNLNEPAVQMNLFFKQAARQSDLPL